MVREIKSKEEFNIILKNNKYVVVDFYAQWCGPCKRIAPEIDKLSQTNINVMFIKVDIEECEELADKYDIKSLPTFLFFVNGEKKDIVLGANLEELKKRVSTILN